MSKEMRPSRREFIARSGVTAAGICFGGFSACSPFVFADYRIDQERIILSKAQFAERPYVIIKMENLRKPVYVRKLNDEEYTAVYMRCTHKGCTVRPSGDILKCPCHGSEYDNRGEVLESPAERPLQKFKVDHDEENVYIY